MTKKFIYTLSYSFLFFACTESCLIGSVIDFEIILPAIDDIIRDTNNKIKRIVTILWVTLFCIWQVSLMYITYFTASPLCNGNA